ncbi:antibiotic biosynthesis monooxygenase family protein [Shimia biformata]|uniref:antibiotic biosynthesis monooxygenase family protein n=1 Tax=Shimia biformata TaxID=1294299 RepID=UPI00194F0C88|nr:antibiotic biosynthesis monooxygenase [Shimia biformata]
MIIRIFQVTTQPGKEAEFADFFHNTAVPLMLKTEGLAAVLPGAPRADSPSAFCFVMVWRDLTSLKAFVGEDYTDAHILPEEAALVKSRSITHYDLVAAGTTVAGLA